jgi:hypothetical protein
MVEEPPPKRPPPPNVFKLDAGAGAAAIDVARFLVANKYVVVDGDQLRGINPYDG